MFHTSNSKSGTVNGLKWICSYGGHLLDSNGTMRVVIDDSKSVVSLEV